MSHAESNREAQEQSTNKSIENLNLELFSPLFAADNTFNSTKDSTNAYIDKIFSEDHSINKINEEIEFLEKKIYLYAVRSKHFANCFTNISAGEDIVKHLSSKTEYIGADNDELDFLKVQINKLPAVYEDIGFKLENYNSSINQFTNNVHMLNCAKNNLYDTKEILQNVIDASKLIDTTNYLLSKNLYSKMPMTITKIENILKFFSEFNEIDRIDQIRKSYYTIKDACKYKLFHKLKHLDVSKFSLDQFENFKSASQVIDAMGSDTRCEFFNYFISHQMNIYTSNFPKDSENSKLTCLDQRFQWFFSYISNYEKNYNQILPKTWKMKIKLIENFCEITHNDVVNMLKINCQSFTAKELILALKIIIKFETYIVVLVENELKNLTREELTESFSIKEKDEYANLSHESMVSSSLSKFENIISSSFDEFMYICVDYYKEFIDNSLKNIKKQETWVALEDTHEKKVFGSAISLVAIFSKIQNRIEFLKKKNCYNEFVNIFEYFFVKYAYFLNTQLDQVSATKYEKNDSLKIEIFFCTLISTSEYCSVVSQIISYTGLDQENLENNNRRTMEKSRSVFSKLTNRARNLLMNYIFQGLEPAFLEMMQTNWNFFSSNTITDASPYLDTINAYLQEHVPQFKKYISPPELFYSENLKKSLIIPDYFQIICDAILLHLTSKFKDVILDCKYISEDAAQQLLTDVAQCRKYLEVLPLIGGNKDVPFTYFKILREEIKSIENLLKIIWTPIEHFLDSFNVLMPDASKEEFLKILRIKGVNEKKQNVIVQNFKRN